MRYGIGLRYFINPQGYRVHLVGLPCAAHSNWGIPALFDTMVQANAYGHRHYGEQNRKSLIWWETISERAAWYRIGIMVEATNGRRQYRNGQWTVDATKLTYEQMLPMLKELAARAARDKLRRENYQLKHKPFEYGKMTYTFE